MFIELTDHLRCPADHEESFLVLLPGEVENRWVRSGQLGCPRCGRTFELKDGVLDTGGEPSAKGGAPSALEAEGLTALAGVHGPGGYMVLVGAVAGSWEKLGELNPGVSLVAVNPGPEVLDRPGISVIRGMDLPIKSGSMRGVVLGPGYGDDPLWVREAARVVLPGLRVVGEGRDPSPEVVDILASTPGVWVATKRR
jgi:uncharacterized protein YbaR (Trm112 family)